MPQSYVSSSGSSAAVDPCQLNPLPGGSADMFIYGNERFRWKVCFCRDQFSLESLAPASQTVNASSVGCIAAGDAIKIWCHENGCEDGLLNGEHEITAVAGDVLTLGNTDMTLLGTTEQSFQAQPVPVGCVDATPVTPPSACHLADIANYTFTGLITNRTPGHRERVALTAYPTAVGSSILYVPEVGEVHQGDTFNAAAAGIVDATVLRVYRDKARINNRVEAVDYVELDQSASTANCVGASTQVGVLAEFRFSAPALGCTTVTLPPSVTRQMPLPSDGGSKTGCGGCYQVGVYSIFAAYLSEDLEPESELIAAGCVHYCPNSMSLA